ncbi:YqjF family protein [Kitasatospora sp. CMC57]
MMITEPLSAHPTRPVRVPVLSQYWRHPLFIHWPVNPAAVAPLLPPDVMPDLWNGTSWVGLVPFQMERLGPGRGPGLPYFGTFPEVNVRLYSVDRQGRRGVVFRSLESPRLAAVLAARASLALPYRWSSTRLAIEGDSYFLATRAHWPSPADRTCVLTAHIGRRLPAPGPLADFLTARWGLHTRVRGRTVYLPTDHPRWPLHEARIGGLSDHLVRAAGIDVHGPPASVLYSPGVPVRFGAWQHV